MIDIALPSQKLKWLPLLVVSVIFVLGIFSVMQLLITPQSLDLKTQDQLQQLDYVRVQRAETVQEKNRELPPKQPEKSVPPPIPSIAPVALNSPTHTAIQSPKLDLPISLDQSVGLGGLLAGGEDGNVIPLVKIPPSYPRQAKANGVEGWVKVGIKISPTGSVLDVEVLDAKPRRVFERATVRSVFRWKFKPEIVDGVAIENYSTQMIHFTLGDS